MMLGSLTATLKENLPETGSHGPAQLGGGLWGSGLRGLGCRGGVWGLGRALGFLFGGVVRSWGMFTGCRVLLGELRQSK